MSSAGAPGCSTADCKSHGTGASAGSAGSTAGGTSAGGRGGSSGGAASSTAGGSTGGHGTSGGAGSTGGAASSTGSATAGGASSGGAASTGNGASSGGVASSGGAASAGGGSTGAGAGGSSTGGQQLCGNGNQPPPDGGCFSDEPENGPCFTNADCQSPLWCGYYGDCDVGVCLAPDAPVDPLACVGNGQACADGGPACCGGSCRSGACAPWQPCGEGQASCQSDADCCSNFSCKAGTCQPSCAGLYGHCQGTGDCCWQQGLACTSIDYGTGTTVACYYAGLVPGMTACGGPCSTVECDFGTPCDPSANPDPCNAAGLVCDGTYGVCREPRYNVGFSFYPEPCLPNGPPCQPIANSQAQTVCAPAPNPDLGNAVADYCVQACQTTADCIDPETTCQPGPDGGGSFCSFWDSCQQSQFFGACDAEGQDDGFCYPVNFGYGVTGFCTQATLDGGGPEARCIGSYAENRQNGGFCDRADVCTPYGLCHPACNAGAAGDDGGPGCPAGQSCIPFEGQQAYPTTIGFCSVACDFTSLSGGGCGLDTSGVQEKCLPLDFWTQQDVPTGFCVASSPNPIPVGQPCPNGEITDVTSSVDACAVGSMCLSLNPFLGAWTCQKLCDVVGAEGFAGCSSGQVCCPVPVPGAVPSHTGYCATSCP